MQHPLKIESDGFYQVGGTLSVYLLEGDELTMINGTLYVNGKEYTEPTSMVRHLLSQYERCANRYIKAEQLLMKIADLPPWKMPFKVLNMVLDYFKSVKEDE